MFFVSSVGVVRYLFHCVHACNYRNGFQRSCNAVYLDFNQHWIYLKDKRDDYGNLNVMRIIRTS